MSFALRREQTLFHCSSTWFRSRWHFAKSPTTYPFEPPGPGPLWVLNDNTLLPGEGYPMHPHRDLQCPTYVVSGELVQTSSRGDRIVTAAGGAQLATFSTAGYWHAEINGSATEPVRFFQGWMLPRLLPLPDDVAAQQWQPADRTNRWLHVMGPDEPLKLEQDAVLAVSRLEPGGSLAWETPPGRSTYVVVLEGRLTGNGQPLDDGDAIWLDGAEALELASQERAELLLVDVPQQYEPMGATTAQRGPAAPHL